MSHYPVKDTVTADGLWFCDLFGGREMCLGGLIDLFLCSLLRTSDSLLHVCVEQHPVVVHLPLIACSRGEESSQ